MAMSRLYCAPLGLREREREREKALFWLESASQTVKQTTTGRARSQYLFPPESMPSKKLAPAQQHSCKVGGPSLAAAAAAAAEN